MKTFTTLLASAVLIAAIQPSIAEQTTTKVGGVNVTIDRSNTPTTTTTQGSVNTSRNTYIYGQSQSFQPNSIGDTNRFNGTTTNNTVGFGWRF